MNAPALKSGRWLPLVAASLCVLAGMTPTVATQDADETPSDHFRREDVFELESVADPRVSPDGRHVVYVRRSNDIMTDRTRSRLWLAAVDGSDHRPLIADGSASMPRWSPTGDRLAYLRSADGATQIHVRWMDTGQSAAVTSVRESPSSLTWSPDGRRIAFTMAVPFEPEPLVKPPKKPEGAEWAEPAKVVDRLRYRADGQGFLEAAYDHVFVVPADGGTPRQLTDGEAHHRGPLAWTADSRALVFSANRDEDWERQTIEADLFRVTLDGDLTALTDRPGSEARPRISPSGTRLAWLQRDNDPVPYANQELVVAGADGADPVVLTSDLDRSVADVQWFSDDALVIQYDDRGRRVLDRVTLDGARERLTDALGGMSLGRPYVSGTFHVGGYGVLAYTRGTPHRPADLVVRAAGEHRRLTELNEDLLGARTLGEVHEFTYASSLDGQQIQGWYILPPDFDPAERHPLLLEIHGGPHLAYGPHFSAELQLYAAAGYVVVYDNHRGSSSYGTDFAMLLMHRYSSADDAADHLSAVDAMIARGFIDEEQLFVTGGSAGGIATAYMVGLTDRFRAAVAAKPVINWISKTLTADSFVYQIRHQFPGPPWEHLEHYWQRSPLSLVGNVTTPTMLITGEEDYRTPISESEQFYQALRLRGVDSVFVRLPDSSHGIASRPSRMISKVDHVLAWFERYRGDGEAEDG